MLYISKSAYSLKQVIAMFDKGHQGVHSAVCTVHCEILSSVPVHVILLIKLKFLTTPNASVGTIEAALLLKRNQTQFIAML